MPKVFIERLGAHVHLGKTDPKPVPGALTFDEVRGYFVKAGGTFPPLPDHFGSGGDFGPGPIAHGGWGMLGNGPCDDGSINQDWAAFEGAGDCAWADPAHDEMEAAKNARRPIPPFTCRNILEQYSAYGGYDLQTGANDNGSNMADVIVWRQTKGLLDTNGVAYKIGKSVTLTPGNLQQAWEAAYVFQNVDLGAVITQANMDEFNADPKGVWGYTPGSPQIGGHAIPEIGRGSLNNSGIVTWAERYGFTEAWFTHQNDEGHAYIDVERYNAVTGETSQGYTDQDLEKYLGLLPAYLAI
jgi:hypothetical protein